MKVYRPMVTGAALRCHSCLRDRGFTEEAISIGCYDTPCRHHAIERNGKHRSIRVRVVHEIRQIVDSIRALWH